MYELNVNERLCQCVLNYITVMVKKDHLNLEVFPLLTILEMQVLNVASYIKENSYNGCPFAAMTLKHSQKPNSYRMFLE